MERSLYYILDEHNHPVPTDSHTADELLKDIDARRMARTEMTIAGSHVEISTVFLCIDERYLLTASEDTEVTLFQTCVFCNNISTGFERYYKTRDEAIQGHHDVCHDIESLCNSLETGKIGWVDVKKKLDQLQGLREIAQITQELGEYD